MFDFRDSLASVRSVVAIGAHPDDIEIGCGGTIAALRSVNPSIEFHWVVLTGTPERTEEARQAAERFAGDSLASCEVGDFRERYLPYDPMVKEYFDALGARLSPDIVLCPWVEDAHQDHRTAAALTANTFRDHLVLQYEIAKYDGDLGRPSVYVPLSREQAEAKVESLFDCFPSQVARDWFTSETFIGLMRLRGIECKAPSGLAEAFHARKVLL